ncbi:tRNA (guanine-N(1)-)-methyltransferase [Gaeumannomyces tritici R3-111a-1]|uniref:tRNA (guanine(9)-N1)-methyltransferase n=1 Tax=Gaeumannomyces tritici (strain R3-111a-1) TaxID=644352 RepID=J3NWX8_GAET3|nr:tRNA (guanine-N(1)-)-methyltransferase [Gaeumannomyces tritici R3-111a-1]EJT75860.1 tRNA (guanine-N(1)-)-methyltransferase [Gaeumannomyces tritici R3-111a-1]
MTDSVPIPEIPPTATAPDSAIDPAPQITQAPEDSPKRMGVDGEQNPTENAGDAAPSGEPAQPPISKSQQKKLKRQLMWEERKDDRKRQRKERRHHQQAKRRAVRAERAAELEATGLDPKAAFHAAKPPRRPPPRQAPVTIILDCDFEKYMSEKELVSLSSQIVRSYSDNRAASVQAHLAISSWGGKLRERFETVLANSHENWKGTRFSEADFVETGRESLEMMKGPKGGILVDSLQPQVAPTEKSPVEGTVAPPAQAPITKDARDPTPVTEAEPGWQGPSIVYLTADSPYTLERLEPNTSYVIGGIIDRNREKGLCYRRARERGVRTAKLPIGEYMVMASRKVLTTNQVVEIMVKWLEHGDWKVAFQQAIPKRKGGVLKGDDPDAEDVDVDEPDDLETGEGYGDEGENEGEDQEDDTPDNGVIVGREGDDTQS